MKPAFTILFVLLSCFAIGQTRYGVLSLKVREDKFNKLWHDFTLKSNDTIIDGYIGYKGKEYMDSLPQGSYILTLYSELGDRIVKEILISPKAKIKMNVTHFYVADTSKISFIDSMSQKDTIKIFVEEHGRCWGNGYTYCQITRQDTAYFIHFGTSEGRKIFQVRKEEVYKLRKIELSGRQYPESRNMLWSRIWMSLNKQMICFNVAGFNYMEELRHNYVDLKAK